MRNSLVGLAFGVIAAFGFLGLMVFVYQQAQQVSTEEHQRFQAEVHVIRDEFAGATIDWALEKLGSGADLILSDSYEDESLGVLVRFNWLAADLAQQIKSDSEPVANDMRREVSDGLAQVADLIAALDLIAEEELPTTEEGKAVQRRRVMQIVASIGAVIDYKLPEQEPSGSQNPEVAGVIDL